MKLIESKVELIEQQPGLEGVYKQIELAGRTCYKSEDKITEDSAKGFVDRMINSKHGAMLEHGTVYLTAYDNYAEDLLKYQTNKYSKYKSYTEYLEDGKSIKVCVTTNLRVLVENNWLDDLKYIGVPTELHEKRITARFTCDMGVGRELTRHRTLSFAQESTRYCNYSKSKFGEELTFVIPTWLDRLRPGDEYGISQVGNGYDPRYIFIHTCNVIEEQYMKLIKLGHKPQEARQILPLGLKTEIVVTGFESDWEHFFELRTAKSAHPDCVKLAVELKQKLTDNGYEFNGNLENN